MSICKALSFVLTAPWELVKLLLSQDCAKDGKLRAGRAETRCVPGVQLAACGPQSSSWETGMPRTDCAAAAADVAAAVDVTATAVTAAAAFVACMGAARSATT